MNLNIDICTEKAQDAMLEELAARLHSYPLTVIYKALEDPEAQAELRGVITSILQRWLSVYGRRQYPAKIDWRQIDARKGGERDDKEV